MTSVARSRQLEQRRRRCRSRTRGTRDCRGRSASRCWRRCSRPGRSSTAAGRSSTSTPSARWLGEEDRLAARRRPAAGTADEYPASSPLALPDQRCRRSSSARRSSPPALTRMRSLSTSGDSLSPHWMFEPPNCFSTFTRPEDLAAGRVEHAQVAARAERVDAIAFDRRRRAGTVAAIVAEPRARAPFPTAACRSRRRTRSRTRCRPARRACTAGPATSQTTSSPRPRPSPATPAAARRPASPSADRVSAETAVAVRPAPLGPVVERAVRNDGGQGHNQASGDKCGRRTAQLSNVLHMNVSGHLDAAELDSGSRRRRAGHYLTMRTDFSSIRVTGVSPFTGVCSMASTTAMPSTTRPNTVYLPSSDGASPVTMKNEVDGARGIVAARHREDALDVLRVVELRLQVAHQLLLLLGQRPARRQRAGLDRRSPHDAMERGAVVDAGRGEPQEVADVLRRLVRKELDRDRAGGRLEHRAILSRARAGDSVGERLRLGRRRVANRRRSNLDPLGRRSPRASAGASEIFCTTSSPSDTRPKIVYLPSSAG